MWLFLKRSSRLFHTIRHLKLSQVVFRLLNLIPIKFKDINNISLISFELESDQFFIYQKNIFDGANFSFLNKEIEFNDKIWTSRSDSILWDYNLNYFDLLNYDQRVDERTKYLLVRSWLRNVNHFQGIAYHPYPISLRVVNLIKWLATENISDDEIRKSLIHQVRFLNLRLEKHLLANHYFINAKALFFAGSYFDNCEAKVWYQNGKDIIIKQLDEQILSDGAHFEFSPMYHNLFILDVFDILVMNRMNKKLFDQSFENILLGKVESMLLWSKSMTHPDGEISFFNDSAMNIAPKINELEKYFHDCFKHMIYPKRQFTHHRSSNFCVVEKEKYKAILDTAEIGPSYNPGHAHADSLSFELSIGKSRMIVNSGISTYESNIDRHLQRGTSAHSTVEVEDTNSSDVWQSFRVGKRASIFDFKIDEDKPLAKISASHDGYNHLLKKCVHNRAWYFNEAFIRIRDTLIGRNVKSIARFYLHPQVEIEKQADNSILLVMPDSKCKLSVIKNNFQIVKSSYHRTFGFSEENSCILVEITNNLSEIELEILE